MGGRFKEKIQYIYISLSNIKRNTLSLILCGLFIFGDVKKEIERNDLTHVMRKKRSRQFPNEEKQFQVVSRHKCNHKLQIITVFTDNIF